MPFPVECFTLQLQMRLSVIIVSYNVKYFLEQCLFSVLPAVCGMDAEVIVVDNASTDGSLDYLRPLFPAVTFIDSGSNLGFGRANNLALQGAKGEYVLFLNPDTLVPEDCFRRCLEFMDRHEKAGALGIRMIDGSGRFLPESKRSFPGTATAFFKLLGLASAFPKSAVFNRYALGHLDQHQNHRVDVLAGAFFLARKSVLDKTGGFDEQFFMYGEDIDLSFRIKQLGYENWYFSGSTIIHFKGESSRKGSPRHTRMFYQAMVVFVRKHYRGRGSLLLKLLLMGGIRLRALWALVTGQRERPVRNLNSPTRAVVVGSAAEHAEVRELCTKTGSNKILVGRIADDAGEPIPLAGTHSLRQVCKEYDIHEVIFCQGAAGYGRIIGLVEGQGGAGKISFHASGSGSIVSSVSSSGQGEVIAAGSPLTSSALCC